MPRGMDFRKPTLGEYTAPSSVRLYPQYPPEVSDCSRNRISVGSGKGLNFITNDLLLLLKYDSRIQFVGFSYEKKGANVVMWKDKEYKYISKREINSIKEVAILRLRNVNRKDC